MKILKTIGLLLAGFTIILGINVSYAEIGFPHQRHTVTRSGDSSARVNNTLVDGTGSINQGINTITNQMSGVIATDETDNYTNSLKKTVKLIQKAINRTLGMLAFVALVYMLYNGFLILTSGSDSKNTDKGKKGISTAAIAITGIGLSWLIISAILWLINNVAATS